MVLFNQVCWIVIRLLFLMSLLMACSTTHEPVDVYPNESAKQIYDHGYNALKGKSYTEAIKRFSALDVQYPDSHYAASAELGLMYADYMKEEYTAAITAAKHFIQLHPTHPQVDYAYYIAALSEYYQHIGFFEKTFSLDLAKRDLTSLRQAFVDFETLATHFPHSRYAAFAKHCATYLRNVLARHELQVAQYYYDRKAYVAAAEHASHVIIMFKGSEAYSQAAVLLVQSYRALGQTTLAQDAMRAMNVKVY